MHLNVKNWPDKAPKSESVLFLSLQFPGQNRLCKTERLHTNGPGQFLCFTHSLSVLKKYNHCPEHHLSPSLLPCFTGPVTLPSVNFRDFRDEVPSRQSELSVSVFTFGHERHARIMLASNSGANEGWFKYCTACLQTPSSHQTDTREGLHSPQGLRRNQKEVKLGWNWPGCSTPHCVFSATH